MVMMFNQLKIYLYMAVVVLIISMLSYVGYVFYDRAEVKKSIIKKDAVIATQKIEVQTTSIAEHAKGKIEQIDKEVTDEAPSTIGVHQYTF